MMMMVDQEDCLFDGKKMLMDEQEDVVLQSHTIQQNRYK